MQERKGYEGSWNAEDPGSALAGDGMEMATKTRPPPSAWAAWGGVRHDVGPRGLVERHDRRSEEFSWMRAMTRRRTSGVGSGRSAWNRIEPLPTLYDASSAAKDFITRVLMR